MRVETKWGYLLRAYKRLVQIMNSIVCCGIITLLLVITANREKGRAPAVTFEIYKWTNNGYPLFSWVLRFVADKLQRLSFFFFLSALNRKVRIIIRKIIASFSHTMRPCLLSLAYLLVVVSVSSVTPGNPWPFLDLTDAQVDVPNIAERYTRTVSRNRNPFISTWTRILQNPAESLEVGVGSRVELECEVSGNPSPQLYWITGNEPERQIQELITQAQETNSIESIEWKDTSKLSSKFVIDCVRPEDQGLIYCISVSRNIVASSTPTILLVNANRTTNCIESEPTITLYSPWIFALQNDTVILPCRFAGEPIPYLYWSDNLNNTINSATHRRHNILSNGDLQITNLEWSDMGRYTCKVQSGYTEKSASTFLYPLARGAPKDE